MKLYVDEAGTAPSPRRVRMYLAEKGLAVPVEKLVLHEQNRTPEFRRKNPIGTLPVPLPAIDFGAHFARSERSAEAAAEFRSWASLSVRFLDRVLQGCAFIAANRISMADVFAFGALDYGVRFAGYPLPEELTHLRSWYASMAARPSAGA